MHEVREALTGCPVRETASIGGRFLEEKPEVFIRMFNKPIFVERPGAPATLDDKDLSFHDGWV